jgi:hypothetical protein
MQTTDLRESCAKGAAKVLGLSHNGVGGITATLLLAREEQLLGGGVPDPAAIGLLQDIKAVMVALETDNKIFAAATWSALRNGLNADGTVRDFKTITSRDQVFDSVLGRLRNAKGCCVDFHAGPGKDAGKSIQLPDSDNMVAGDEKRLFRAEVEIARLPTRYAFLPLMVTGESMDQASSFSGSIDPFAAIAMAVMAKQSLLAIVDLELLDHQVLYSKEGRILGGMDTSSLENWKAAMYQQVVVRGPHVGQEEGPGAESLPLPLHDEPGLLWGGLDSLGNHFLRKTICGIIRLQDIKWIGNHMWHRYTHH